ncbi:hypothetical protein COMA2_20127 [Candidatus Nitrospira nitrificans]|uniref:Uncharacterized protein n=1 Tax=Candidatus Nitrospira nitrificans TaxID=1742973 RepID=A0A0S4LEN6_9BACT|nr:hypothetical protein COMA2_20127 [Candidatus Nitrospira nitrificans]
MGSIGEDSREGCGLSEVRKGSMTHVAVVLIGPLTFAISPATLRDSTSRATWHAPEL